MIAPSRSRFHRCYQSWYRQKTSCPTCRAPVWNIKLDVEFAELCGSEITTKAETPSNVDNLALPRDEVAAVASHAATDRRSIHIAWPAGLTLANHHRESGEVVVKVIKVMSGNGGYLAGIRVGDIIHAVNGAEVHDHATAVDFIERRCRAGDCMVEVRTPYSLGRQTAAWLTRIRARVAARRQARGAFSPAVEGFGEEETTGNTIIESARTTSRPLPVPIVQSRSWSTS
jgi:hypothetical protein